MASAESNKQAASSLAGEKDVQNIIAQGKRALEYATNRQEIPADFVKAMEKIINRSFPLPQTAATNAAKSDLSTVGLALCNASITFSPILTALDTNKQIAQTNIRTQAALLRVYGFFLRDASRPRSGREKSPQNKMNIFEEAVRTVWRCFASDNLALAQTVLERCAVYVDQDDTTTPIMRLAPTSGTSPLPVIQKNKLQYNLLRIAAGSRQENDACEDFFYSKLDQHVLTRCPELAKQAATVFYEVANRHYRIQNWKTSKTWSERAIDALNVRDSLVPSSFFDQKLRIRITRLLVLTMLSFDDEKQRLLASSLVTSLDHECGVGNCMLILKLRFEVCVARKPVDLDEFQGLLDQVTVATNVSDHTFVIAMDIFKKARSVNSLTTLVALSDMITHKILPKLAQENGKDSAYRAQMEKALITCFFIATSPLEIPTAHIIIDLTLLMDNVYRSTNGPLSSEATLAAQAMLWRYAGGSRPDIAKEWYEVMVHPLFDNTGPENRSKIHRKLIQNALDLADIDGACQVLCTMSESSRAEPQTQILVCKVALRSGNVDLLVSTLSSLATGSKESSRFLLWCATEATMSGSRAMAVVALQTLLDARPVGVDWTILLRCTIKLQIEELESLSEAIPDAMAKVVQIFQDAAANLGTLGNTLADKWENEIQWWSKTAYNFGTKHFSTTDPLTTIGIFEACAKFLAVYSNSNTGQRENILKRQTGCHFIIATAHVLLGRTANRGSDEERSHYSEVFQHLEAFGKYSSRLPLHAKDQQLDNNSFTCLTYGLESMLRLRLWAALPKWVDDILNFPKTDRWERLVDLVLILHRETMIIADINGDITNRISQLLERCINETWKKNKDIVKMSRWLRLTYHIHLHPRGARHGRNVHNGRKFALQIVQQAASVAERGWRTKSDGTNGTVEKYPDDELHFLAATAFNEAVDLISEHHQPAALEWMAAALDLARYADDNGALHATLTEKQELIKKHMGLSSV